MWRTRSDRLRRAANVILGHRDLVRRDGRGPRHARRARSASNVVASQAELHARYGGVVPEVASRRHLELVAPVVCARRSTRRTRRSTTSRRVAVTQGPGADRRAARRSLGGEGARVGTRGCRSSPVDHLHGHVASLFLAPDPLEPPFLCLLASGGHTLLLDVQRPARLPRARDDARRRRRRGVRQGRAAARARLPGRRRDRPARARGRRRGVPLPRRARARARLLLLGPEDGAPLRGARPRPGRARGRRADLAASYQRAIVRALVERAWAARAAGARGSPSSAASPRTPSCAPRSPGAALAPLALCTDNAAMIASAARYGEPVAYPGYLALDAYASRRREPPPARARSAVVAVGRRRPRSRAATAARGARRGAGRRGRWRGLVGVRAAAGVGRAAGDRRAAGAVPRRPRRRGGRRGDEAQEPRGRSRRCRPAAAALRARLPRRRRAADFRTRAC